MKSWKKPTNEMIDNALGSIKKEVDRRYFFSRLKNPLWIQPLVERGYFQSPPRIRCFDDDYVQFPPWPELQYLKNMSRDVPDEVINLVLELPETDNPSVYNEILEIAMQLHGERSAQLMPKILESLTLDHQVKVHNYTELLNHWTKENQISAALEVSRLLVAFVPDPQSDIKQRRRKENSTDLGIRLETALEPSPRIASWEYGEMLFKRVHPLAERQPFKVALILIDTTASMICLCTHHADSAKMDDLSEAWCERLGSVDSKSVDCKKALVYSMTFVCEQVYEKSPDAVVALDTELRNQQWKVFARLRQHLYARYPSEQTKPWIRELILAQEDYHLWEHRYEFQQMIRSACEYFRASLLSKDERELIFSAIRSGPSKANHQAWLKLVGEEFTKDSFRRRQRHFHRLQLNPFALVLFDEYKSYFQELEKDAANPISDEDYPPIRTKGGVVSNRSPRSPETLEKLADEELLAAINEWEGNELASEGNSLVEINLEGLARAFQTVFTKSILTDANRLRFWIENCARIERPIYVRMMIDGMQSDVREKNFDKLNEWLTFCEWVLSKPNERRETDYRLGRLGDESRENPDWYNSRELVGDFIDTCFEKDLDVPVTARGQIAKLLEMLCTQFDRHLDPNMFRDNLIDKAINSVRGRALRTLAKFGYWLRGYDSASQLPEITTILEKRFAPKTKHSLTLPEYAILGRDYRFFFTLNDSWATEHRPDFFPQGMLPAWLAAFSSFLHHNPPFERTFEIFRDDFDFALQYLIEFKNRDVNEEKELNIFGRPMKQNSPTEILIDSLSHHLFCYYLWGMYPLKGSLDHDEHLSRLEQFYQVTTNNREQWANLFYYVGDLLFNTEHLPKELRDRIITFFDWRFAAKEPTELQQFTGWLEAECLDAEWRLDAYSKVLDVIQTGDMSIATQVQVLCQLLPNHTAKVIECFAKLTDGRRDGNIFIYTEEAKIILKAGLASDDQNVKQNAKLAHENLLRVGRFDLLDLED